MSSDVKHEIVVVSESGTKAEEVELLEIATHFFLKELSNIKKINKIHGEVNIVSEVKSEAADEILSGDMMEIKDYMLADGRVCNYYVCRLADYTNSAETIRTLAHELVHVWQTETGELRTTKDHEWFWKGKSYGFLPYKGTFEDYLLPWEKQADIIDLKLTKKFYRTYFSNW